MKSQNYLKLTPFRASHPYICSGNGLHFLPLCLFFSCLIFLTGCSEPVDEAPETAARNGVVTSESPPPQSQKRSQHAGHSEPVATSKDTENNTTALEPISKSAEKIPGQQPAGKLLDRDRLKELGIQIFESDCLVLMTDGVQDDDRKNFQRLPEMITQLKKQLKAKYPQMQLQTELMGYVMKDRPLYLQAGLLPKDFANLWHGGNIKQTFWMNEQKTNYYREHLLIHEAMHCLMEYQKKDWPVWYWEGMAEFYGNHRLANGAEIQFGVTPGQKQIEGGFGRLKIIRDEIKTGNFQAAAKIQHLSKNNFYPHKTSYAWSWALCHFLANHPDSRSKFPALMMCNTRSQFNQQVNEIFPPEDAKWNADWAVFASSLVSDFDLEQNRILWKKAKQGSTKNSILIQANRNWQASGISVVQANEYTITASGVYSVAQMPKPWVCESQGVSIEYIDGQPLGQLQAVLFTPQRKGKFHDHGFLKVIPVGRELKFQPEVSGTLFFRINDRASSWRNNKAAVTVTVK